MRPAQFLPWLIGAVVILAGIAIILHFRHALVSRRRRKSHSRIVSKSHRPSVRFSVRPPKK